MWDRTGWLRIGWHRTGWHRATGTALAGTARDCRAGRVLERRVTVSESELHAGEQSAEQSADAVLGEPGGLGMPADATGASDDALSDDAF